MRFHHLGVILPSFSDFSSSSYVEGLALKAESEYFEDEVIGVGVQFFLDASGLRYELIHPLSDRSPITDQVRNRINTLNHVAYVAADLIVTADLLRSKKFIPVCEPLPALAFDGRKVMFMMNSNGLLLELIEGR